MIWCGRDRWCHVAVVIDCASRELLGWRLSKHGNAKTAESALEEALINCFGHLGRVTAPHCSSGATTAWCFAQHATRQR
ncbi:MAG: transposase family protein [Pseudomonadota bacterium]